MSHYIQDISTLQIAGAVSAGVLSFYLLSKWRSQRRYTFPPQPPGKFIVGNASELTDSLSRLNLFLTDYAEQLGNVYTLDMMGTKMIVVNDSDSIREVVLRVENIHDRPPSYRVDYMLDFEEDITFGKYSPKWLAMKKAAFTSMKTYSDGLKKVEALSHQMITDLVSEFASHKGQPFNYKSCLKKSITNFMSWLVYGEGMEGEELEEYQTVSELTLDVFAMKGFAALIDQFPMLTYFPSDIMRKMNKLKNVSNKIFGARMQKGQARYDPNDVKCSLDVLFTMQKENHLTDACLDRITRDMIDAGVDTTSATLTYFVQLMTKYPEIQAKAQKYIDEAIGDRLPCISDKASLPYLEALTLEVLRLLTPAPVVSRCAQKDTDLLGYHIPKGTMIVINIWKMHHEKEYWSSPFEFKPERFIGEDGKVLPADHPIRKNFLPFGAGKRVCVGEVLARNRLFLFCTSLLQRFTFKPEIEGEPYDCDPRTIEQGLVLFPADIKVRAIFKTED